MVSDGGCFQPLLANLTIKVVMPVMVYKWVIEKGLGAGYVFQGVFHHTVAPALCAGVMVAPMTSPCQDAMRFLNHGLSMSPKRL